MTLIRVAPPAPAMRHTVASRIVSDAQKSPGKGGAPRSITTLPTEPMGSMELRCSKCNERVYRLRSTPRGRDLCVRCDNGLKDTPDSPLVRVGKRFNM